MTQEQLKQFKIDFEIQLGQFMELRNDEISDPVSRSPRWNKSIQQIEFYNDTGKCISFRVKDVPDTPSEDDQKTLRQAMYDICAKQGFQPRLTSHLSRGTRDKIKQKDPETWQAFVGKHAPRLKRYAKKYLNGKRKTILDPEDVVGMAYGNLLETLKNDRLGKNTSPSSFLDRAVFHIINNTGRNRWALGRESNGMDGDTFPEDPLNTEREARLEILREQFPRILEEARKNMNQNQQTALDIIIQNIQDDNNPFLSQYELGTRLKASGTNSNVKMMGYSRRSEITKIIQSTAHQMGPDYEDAAAIIDTIVRANSKGSVVRS